MHVNYLMTNYYEKCIDTIFKNMKSDEGSERCQFANDTISKKLKSDNLKLIKYLRI